MIVYDEAKLEELRKPYDPVPGGFCGIRLSWELALGEWLLGVGFWELWELGSWELGVVLYSSARYG